MNYKLQPISTSIKKNSILTHIGKKLQDRQFSQYFLSKKASGSKIVFGFFFWFSKTVSVFDLTFKFWVSISKSVRFMDNFKSFAFMKQNFPLYLCIVFYWLSQKEKITIYPSTDLLIYFLLNRVESIYIYIYTIGLRKTVKVFFVILRALCNIKTALDLYNLIDRAERHDLKSRLWCLFYLTLPS